MQITHIDADNNTYHYTEGILSGRRTLFINDVEQAVISRKEFLEAATGGRIIVKGVFITGVKLVFPGGKVVNIVQNKWYDWFLIFLPCIYFALAFLGGAIGGFVSAFAVLFAMSSNAIVLHSHFNLFIKIIFCILIFIGIGFAALCVYALIVGGFAIAFPEMFS